MQSPKEAASLVSHLLAGRTRREAKWRELSQWICPHRGLFNNHSRAYEDEREQQMYFTHAASQAALRGASGITSGMTPTNVSWFTPSFRDEQIMEAKGTRAWLDAVNREMKDCLEAGGFYQAIQAFNLDLLWAGCALLYSELGEDCPLMFECPQVGTYCVQTDRRGKLLTVARRMQFTIEELETEFGRGKMSRNAQSLIDKNPYNQVPVWQLVRYARKGRFVVESFYWEEGNTDNFLRVHGYNEMPFFFTCWHETDTPYGMGPGDAALPDAMQMDTLERRKLDGIGKITDPPVVAPVTMKDMLRLGPGQITWAAGPTSVEPIYNMAPFASFFGNLLGEIQQVNMRLEQAMYAAVFASIPIDQRPSGMSATEFMERKREAMQQLGPVMQAYTPNVLKPLLYRVLKTLDRNDALPLQPESLQQYEAIVRMEFNGPMVNAMRQSDGQAMSAFLQSVSTIAQASQNPDVFDKLDCDQMVDEYATAYGTPGSVVRSDEETAQIRQERQQMQMMQMQMQQAMQQGQLNQMQASAMNQEAQALSAMQGEQDG